MGDQLRNRLIVAILILLLVRWYIDKTKTEHMAVPQSVTEFNEFAKRLYTNGNVPTSLTVDGGLTVGGVIASKTHDFKLGLTSDRGNCNGCRALVKGGGPELIINYENDFKNGTHVMGNLKTSGDLNVAGNITSKSKRARWIRLGNRPRGGMDIAHPHWTIIEVEVFVKSGNDLHNVARGKGVHLIRNAPHPGTAAYHITNGILFYNDAHNNKAPADNWRKGFMTTNPHDYGELEIDLGGEHTIEMIIVHGRYHGAYENRANGTWIELIGQDRKQNRLIQTGVWQRTYSKEFLL